MPDAVVNEAHALPNVAIVGRPNVGKSALFNRLVRRKIAIVHDQPGITRDRLSAICTRGERPFTLWDTGGIFGAGESELTQQVRRAALDAGALGCSISGAGPTMFAWSPSASADGVLEAMSREFAQRSIQIDKWVTEVQSDGGARVVGP